MIYKYEVITVGKYAVKKVHPDCKLIYELVFIKNDGSDDETILFDTLSESLFYANYFSTILRKNGTRVELRAFEIPERFDLELFYAGVDGDVDYYLYRDNYSVVKYYDVRESKKRFKRS